MGGLVGDGGGWWWGIEKKIKKESEHDLSERETRARERNRQRRDDNKFSKGGVMECSRSDRSSGWCWVLGEGGGGGREVEGGKG